MVRCCNSRMCRLQDFLKETRKITRTTREIYDDVKPMLRDAYLAVVVPVAGVGVLDRLL